jgi:tRNA(Ile)-lysidine synthase
MLDIGQRVGLAVSGGADSVFLLHLLHELAPRWNLRLSVIHINHGIRGQASRDDAEFVRALAGTFQLPFHLHEADVSVIDDNLEQAARRIRLSFYHELLSGQLDRVATGHTRNDQAETVLFRILRGSGITGLSGIRPITQKGLVRPLLDLDRSEIEAWLRSRRIPWREDATNQDLSYARNRLRHQFLPQLRQAFNPNLDEALGRLATIAQDEEEFWQAEIPNQNPTSQAVVLPINDLATAPRALARRRLRALAGPLNFEHLDRILDLARSPQGSGRLQLPGLDVWRSFDWLRLAPPALHTGPDCGFTAPITIPGSIVLPGAPATLSFALINRGESAESYDKLKEELDWSSAGSAPLELRNWRPGDRYRPAGQSHAKNIKLLFQNARIPLWERRNWPIVTCGGVIAWSRRFGPDADFAAGPETRIALRISEDLTANESDVRVMASYLYRGSQENE